MAYNSVHSAFNTDPFPNQPSHYALLGLHPSSGEQQIRRAYRDLSRLYHPDTTKLAPELAKQKFQQLNAAYAILSRPERRRLYDLSIGYARFVVVAAPASRPPHFDHGSQSPSRYQQSKTTASAYLDATDRPLSAGELFALFIMVVTLLGCLMIAIVVGLSQPHPVIQAEFAQELGLIAPSFSQATNHDVLQETATLENTNPLVPPH